MEKLNGVMPWNERSEALTSPTMWMDLEHTMLREREAEREGHTLIPSTENVQIRQLLETVRD